MIRIGHTRMRWIPALQELRPPMRSFSTTAAVYQNGHSRPVSRASKCRRSGKEQNGYFEPNAGAGDLYSREKFGDCQLHVEWQEPEGITGSGQGRGNSGVFLQSRYEIQVLDSYRAATYADGQAAAIYGQWPPLVNPMRKPGEWQTYDIIFQSPKFDGDKLVEPAYVTVLFNGVLVHNHQKFNGPTNHRQVDPYVPYDSTGRLRLQDHQSSRPVRYRNIWVRKLAGYDLPEEK